MSSRRYLLSADQASGQRNRFWDRVTPGQLVLAATALVLAMLLQARVAVAGDERYSDLAAVGTGAMVVEQGAGYQGLLRLNSHFDLKVTGMLVHARVTQAFKNNSQDWVAATYVFPLPSNSAVNSMRMIIGEREIEGIIKERRQAQQIFVKAKRQGKQAGLLEQQRPNLFTTRVANIGPGEQIDVEFSYLQTLQLADNEFTLRLPLTLTPRYVPGVVDSEQTVEPANQQTFILPTHGWAYATDQVPDAPAVTPPQLTHGQLMQSGNSASHQATIELDLQPGFDLAEVHSPYHDISTQRTSDHYQITTKKSSVIMNRDFVLTWRPVPQQAPQAALFQAPEHPDAPPSQHALLMLMPPQAASAAVVPPRELIIVVDTSGSMAGTSIVQAKQAVLMALNRLRSQDRFNLIEFNSSHRALFPNSQPAEPRQINQARRFVQGLKANGGTEMAAALNAAFRFPVDEALLRQVVFITDGSVANEHALFELIHRGLGNSRLYTVGIGSAPNAFFMRKAAEFGKGTYAMIGAQQEVQQAMQGLFSKIEKPMMTNISVQAAGVETEMFPQVIPDLYQGEPLVVHARFARWPNEIQVQGEFNGQPWQRVFPIGRQQPGESGIRTLWAREKVQHLEDLGTKAGQRNQYQADITQLGLDYGIVTRFTSFVAVAKEPVRPPGEPLQNKPLPNLMPSGSQQQPPSVGMPQTALGLSQRLLLGVLSLLAALLLWAITSRKVKYRCHYSVIGLPIGQESVS